MKGATEVERYFIIIIIIIIISIIIISQEPFALFMGAASAW